MKCKDCRYWIAPEADGVSLGAIWGECNRIKDSTLIAIYPVSGIDSDAKIETDIHPDFGCVLFEDKE